MQLRRIAIAAVIAEMIPILLLVAAVSVYSASGGSDPNSFARRTSEWFSPSVGSIIAFFVTLLAVRRRPLALQHGIAIGISIALLDLGIVALQGTPFQTLFVVSALGRVAAGTLAGIIARNN
jgi:hypothetical protein